MRPKAGTAACDAMNYENKALLSMNGASCAWISPEATVTDLNTNNIQI
jgi:hypothetical protein